MRNSCDNFSNSCYNLIISRCKMTKYNKSQQVEYLTNQGGKLRGGKKMLIIIYFFVYK